MKPIVAGLLLCGVALFSLHAQIENGITYPIVDTAQDKCFDAHSVIAPPERETPFYGQDAQTRRNPPSYVDNKDGTITDRVTGLMWQKTPGRKLTWDEAVASVDAFNKLAPPLGGHADWRLPTIKELYSLIEFVGVDPRPEATAAGGLIPYIDTRYFDFHYGDVLKGERIIDVQYWSATKYVATTMNGNRTAFGVNFADGRIKGYPADLAGPAAGKLDANGMGPQARQLGLKAQVRYVRGNPDYGLNRFVDNKDGTVSDLATGLLWQKGDSGKGLNWQEALSYAETLSVNGVVRWRLPNAKELQSLVDYTRSPDTTDSAAIDPVFDVTGIQNEGGKPDFPGYWTSTTHSSDGLHADAAVYLAFGRALGFMGMPPGSQINVRLMDVHGAGAQRADLKEGDPAKLPRGRGPQGDVMRIYNFARCVRDIPPPAAK